MTDQEVLQSVEWIVSDDFCEDLDMRIHMSDEVVSDDLKTANEKLSSIYRIVHSAITSKICHEVHSDWREETEKNFKAEIIANAKIIEELCEKHGS